METNPILLEVFKNRFSAIAEEMGMALIRTSFSPNIKERRDVSCAIFDAVGDMVAQAAHIPVHLGSMPLSVKAAIAECPMKPGDMVMLNDPYKGGTHLPDITLVAPVFAENATTPDFYVANRAHHADVGGMSAGSLPLSTSLFQEGIIIPPVRIVKDGVIDPDLMRFFLDNVRTPQERQGDFAAQVMANNTGVSRTTALLEKYGRETVGAYAAKLIDYAENMTRQAISELPDGQYIFEDVLDDDGQGAADIAIRLQLDIAGDEVVLDFSASDDNVRGSVNAVKAITLSAVLYVFRCLVETDIPTNAGIMRPLTVKTRHGSVVDARFPAAVACGNVETSQRIVDVLLGALAQAAPNRIPAASQGTMNNVIIGGMDTRSGTNVSFSYYETIAGGMGASSNAPGASAVHSHMTNTLNTPVEALEYAYPFRVTQVAVRSHSGGEGKYRGGDGMIREIELLDDAEITIQSERRRHGPYGLAGGHSGKPGRNSLVRDGKEQEMPAKFHLLAQKGDRLRIETPGGGGFGCRDDD